MNIQAVFIDRDGTLGGSDKVVYTGDFELFPGVKQSIKLLKDNNILVYSFTNQPGIATGEATVWYSCLILQSSGSKTRK